MTFFSSMTVAKRLYLGFGLMLAILMGVALVAIAKVSAINGALQANSGEHAALQRHAINFRGSAHDRAIAVRDVVLSASSADRAKEVATIEALAGFYAKSAGPLEALVQKSADVAELNVLYGAIKDIENQSVATTQAVIAKVEASDNAGAQAQLWNEAKPQYVAWLGAINKLIDYEESRIQAMNSVAMDQASSFLYVMMAALAGALGCGMVLAWIISRSLVQQLGAEPAELGQVAQRVSQGDLSPVLGASGAPAGSVLASLGAMQASLANVVGQVRNASDSIATGSSEIASGNADLSSRTELQASSLQQASNAMAQMNNTVQGNADTARQAAQLAGAASGAAVKGGEVVGQVVATMDDITTSSRKIGDIIGVIDGIAFQTNILALNAAVEAARAGEQGRGFAVVAGEVRSLAQRSAEAAKEIKALIGASVDKVEAGSRLVSDAGRAMEDIVSQVRRVSDLINEISASTIEQTEGIGHVSESVTSLDHSTQQNAALVEQSAAAAASLEQQAARLTDVVKTFRLAHSS
ncbi:methyl-accepting chemotaxis protein [Hydrogenophaga sp.]|uniref:methyl-accepting chemotaxis protein n=1 Tax=Hydrogenophaga sp. TaxID=1904254 RepID=UPI00262581AB|nr:methyl-accepting chemotaxis protein [Hydrogenophaga sp.]MDM7948509.1 methyl-accepting chemotaxis protein [Hydrogenophaga sp.]